MTGLKETIAAISTPSGKGGIAVLRISGLEAVRIVRSVFPFPGKSAHFESHRVYHGWIQDGEERIDEVIVTWFKAPASYTGEDVVEISCHGGNFVSQRILEAVVKNGARIAEPGEFTKRAFMNGKMDLSQAEAVADLIQAQTEASRRVAVYQLEKRLSNRLNQIRDQLIEVCSHLEIELDFGEEGIEFVSREKLGKDLRAIRSEIDELIQSYERGRVCREGVRMVILGRPNVGKSSILNALVEKERAIVTEIPGTTRDLIEDVLDIEGVLFTITDTAGVRDTKRIRDPIEKEGISRSERALKAADLVLLVFDGSQPFSEEDGRIVQMVKREKKKTIGVINKTDLPLRFEENVFTQKMKHTPRLRVSALNRKGIGDLIRTLRDQVLSGGLPVEGELVLTNLRHRDALRRVYTFIRQAMESLKKNMSQEFIAVDLRGALNGMGEITGQTTPEEVLNRIFSEFCIGK